LAVFGDDTKADAEAVRRANEELFREKQRRRNQANKALEASLGGASKEQLTYPEVARRKPVSIKALAFFGDEALDLQAKQVVTNDRLPSIKAMKVFGSASALAPAKARKILGSSDDDGEARALADKHWIDEMVKRADDFTKEVMARRPDESIQAIPMDKGPIAAKALAFFGDEGLQKKSLRALKTRAPPKAIHILGEAGLAGTKAGILTGQLEDIEHPKKKSRFSPLVNYRKLFRYALGEA